MTLNVESIFLYFSTMRFKKHTLEKTLKTEVPLSELAWYLYTEWWAPISDLH